MYYCKVCSTESDIAELCSGCGGMMTITTGQHLYAIEIVDKLATKRAGEPIIYERRGPFASLMDADNWWHRHQDMPKYLGCDAFTVILEPVGEQYD